MSNKQTIFCGNNPKYLAKEFIKESNASNSASAFRIPSLVNAGGTLVAAIDKAATGADWGFIEIAVRTSNDAGKTWSNIKTIASPPARVISDSIDNTASAFYIDPCMGVAPNGDIVMLVTYFPESKGIHNKKMLETKAAYTKFDGMVCPLIYDRDGNHYIVLNDGSVLDSSKSKTPYTCNFAKGILAKDGEYVGNIYLNGAIGRSDSDGITTTFGAPLKTPKRSYVFMLRSTDKGETWSDPIDITGQVLNPAVDGPFFAVAPGTAATTQNGRMIFPLYTVKGTVCIYSDDNGHTFHRNSTVPYAAGKGEWVPVEAPKGELVAFSRERGYKKVTTSISTNNGIVWTKTKSAPFRAPHCQKNAIVIGDKVYVSAPSAKQREKGAINVGTFDYDKKGNLKGIKWDKDARISVNDGFFAYSCMAPVDDHTIGILYEDQPSSHIVFETFGI